MLRTLWMWDPVSSGNKRAFDEPHAYENNKWFFDKSVWQKMFRMMSGCDFNALVLANTHPFPFMIDLAGYPEAKVVDESELLAYQQMHHWIFETALDYDIAPYLCFHLIYLPDGLAKARGIDVEQAPAPDDFTLEYTQHCLRTVLGTYPELSGFIADVSGINAEPAAQAQFVQQAILDTLDSARPDASIYLRGFTGEPAELVSRVHRRSRPIHYIARYTHGHLVGAGGDDVFKAWQDEVGPEFLMAEMDACNFEPWTSFSFDTAEEVVRDIEETGLNGFLLHPLGEFEWPHTSDTYFKYQWQRDMAWYNVWGGTSIAQMQRQGQPKWLTRNSRVLPGFAAGSRILELMSLYIAGNMGCGWQPQFCSVADPDSGKSHLLSITDLLEAGADRDGSWWEEVTGDTVVSLAEYLESGTPQDEYGPDELIEELADLAEQAVAAGEKGMRSASGEKELPSFARDALCMGRLGEFYIERFRAALAHARGGDEEAIEHMTRALGFFREIRAIDMSHRKLFRVRTDSAARTGDWTAVVRALEAELADASKGTYNPGTTYEI